ncbi:MAG: hypothetical protein JWQ66_2079 [Mucilaginibacter sp.]|nr:hypothetical protein [Mucilaginibacter sp.]
MLKKIHSNRDHRDTIYSEVRKEFGVYFKIAGNSIKRCLGSYPRFFFGLMTLLLITSMFLSFTVFRHRDKVAPVTKKAINPVGDGFDRIMRASEQLRETIELKRLVDSISSKKLLSEKDSVALDSALDRLREINKPSN